MKIQAYIYHKRAEKYSDCQDYFGIDSRNNRLAVSDGMSQSIYPQWWAKILVNAYLSEGKIPLISSEIQKYQDVWQDEVQEEIQRREEAGKNPWRLKNAFSEKSGAGATLCGFSWNGEEWDCECIGDTSAIIVKPDYTIDILSSQEGEFGNHPDYLDSFHNGKGDVKSFHGAFKDARYILIVTDPYSELFQKHHTNSQFLEDRMKELLALSDHESYTALVERWRDDFDMHNDDSTIVILSDLSIGGVYASWIDNLETLCEDEATKTVALNQTVNSIKEERESASSEKILDSSSQSPKSNCIEQPTQEIESQDKAAQLFRAAGKSALKHYNGKRSKNKVIDYLKDLLNPIVSEFLSKK